MQSRRRRKKAARRRCARPGEAKPAPVRSSQSGGRAGRARRRMVAWRTIGMSGSQWRNSGPFRRPKHRRDSSRDVDGNRRDLPHKSRAASLAGCNVTRLPPASVLKCAGGERRLTNLDADVFRLCRGCVRGDCGLLSFLGVTALGQVRVMGRAEDGVAGAVRLAADACGQRRSGPHLCRLRRRLYRGVADLDVVGRGVGARSLRHDRRGHLLAGRGRDPVGPRALSSYADRPAMPPIARRSATLPPTAVPSAIRPNRVFF